MVRRALLALALAAATAVRAAALGANVREVHAAGSTVRAVVTIRDVIPGRFAKIIERGGQLHLRVQAEFWENRPVWDRLVYPAIIRMLRLTRPPGSADLEIDDSAGRSTTYGTTPNPLELAIDLGNADRIASAGRYYVHVVATVGTLAERDVNEVGDAVFGRESDENALGSFGRMIFQTALKLSDYLQSESVEVKSRRVAGTDIVH